MVNLFNKKPTMWCGCDLIDGSAGVLSAKLRSVSLALVSSSAASCILFLEGKS